MARSPSPQLPTGSIARCKLLRDLQVGESVVVGSEGIRTKRNATTIKKVATEEFSFMGAGVSSERRVELVVEQIAWDLRQIRDRGGKVAVVAGPVVIHTGGSKHLNQLIREGYVHALSRWQCDRRSRYRAILMGTSLGVDMQRGISVHGGHRHHLKAINTIRRCGSIANAVEQGVLQSGVMYECVKHNVPFSLAGSIRDDGPLPDTQMDLVAAQADYARSDRRCRPDFDALKYAPLDRRRKYDSSRRQNGLYRYQSRRCDQTKRSRLDRVDRRRHRRRAILEPIGTTTQ